MSSYKFLISRASVVGLFLGISAIQLLSIPGQFAHMRKVGGISLLVEIALTVVVGVWLFCGQLALIAAWKIVGEMESERFLGSKSLLWMNRLVKVMKIACVFPTILFAILVPQADDPGFFVLLLLVFTFLVALTTMSSLIKDQLSNLAEN